MFNGRKTNNGSTGCRPCGTKNTGRTVFATVINLSLPSGAFKTFRKGHAEEVSDMDYDFLKQYGNVTVNGEEKPVFEVVE